MNVHEPHIKTINLRRIMRYMDVHTGDSFLVAGYTDNRNIQSDMYKLREELGIDIEIVQKQYLLVDAEDKTVDRCWLVTVIKGDNLNRKFKKAGRPKLV